MKTYLLMGMTVIAISLVGWGIAAAQQTVPGKSVRFEIATEPGFQATDSHRWMETLSKAGAANIRIREARPGDQPELSQTPGGGGFQVTGVLTRDNRLRLPGGTFSIGQSRAIADWIERLGTEGAENFGAPKGAFGLTESQLLQLHDDLTRTVMFSTKQLGAGEVVRRILDELTTEVAIDPAARAALAGDWKVPDELQGLSTGTALAAALRPLGLVLVPQPAGGGNAGLRITESSQVKQQVWPVGWEPKEPAGKVLPKAMEFLSVEIRDIPAIDVVDSIAGRLETPYLLDHNSIARHEADPATKVSIPEDRTFYKRILDRALAQAMLKAEIRLDENDKPFLWITTMKQ